ncbi:MAG: response regulator [Treponema sp.]|nr:response regulator [Treponema sp.]
MIHVLIVEDEEIIRNGLLYTIDWLALNAVVVGSAASGKEGLQKIKELKPELVLTDIRMPEMDGLSMIRQAQTDGCSFIPVVLTSYSDFEYARQAIELHVFDYLLKPVDDEKLSDIVQRAAEQIEKEVKLHTLQDVHADISNDDTVLLKTTSDNPYVNECLQIITQDYKGHPSIEQIAEQLCVSPSYLSRLFKKNTSMTFLDFLNRYRIQKAVELLSAQKLKVYEVAVACGFTDYKRFYEVFRSYTGISPTDFVKNGYCIIRN